MEAEHKKNHFSLGNILLVMSAVVILLAIVTAVYYYHRYQQAKSLLQNSSGEAQFQAQELISKVGKLIDLPTNETPQIATVTDVTKLKGQSFYANASNGDKVLIYAKAREAILYSPTENKIIAVAPINLEASAPSVTPYPTTNYTLSPTAAPTKIPLTPTPASNPSTGPSAVSSGRIGSGQGATAPSPTKSQ